MGDLIPFAGMVTGILITGMVGFAVMRVFQGPVGQAIGRRIHGASSDDAELVLSLQEMTDRVDQMEQRLLESEERLDFAERLLAAGSGTSPKAGG